MSAPVAGHPPTRTFKPRRRRLSPTLAAARERLGARWELAAHGPELVWAEVFGREAPVVLEIGFGHGEALLAYASAHPDRGVVGVDVHTPGVAKVLAGAEAAGLGNVRVVHGDALELLARVPVASLAAVHVLFPDPWPKARQRPRRLVRPEVVVALVARLAVGGRLHLATDEPGYGDQIVAVCGAVPGLRGGVVGRPAWRTTTRYEARAVEGGRAVVELAYERG